MRDLIIKSFEGIILVVGAIIAALGIGFGIDAISNGQVRWGLNHMVVGLSCGILIVGLSYIALSILENTRRTADAVEKLASR